MKNSEAAIMIIGEKGRWAVTFVCLLVCVGVPKQFLDIQYNL